MIHYIQSTWRRKTSEDYWEANQIYFSYEQSLQFKHWISVSADLFWVLSLIIKCLEKNSTWIVWKIFEEVQIQVSKEIPLSPFYTQFRKIPIHHILLSLVGSRYICFIFSYFLFYRWDFVLKFDSNIETERSAIAEMDEPKNINSSDLGEKNSCLFNTKRSREDKSYRDRKPIIT